MRASYPEQTYARLAAVKTSYDQATDLIGGFQAWQAAGLPVTRPVQPTTPWLPRHDI